MSEVLYRKYRPQSFEDVMGQGHVVSVLKKQADQKSPSHAYLFVGGRGLGKTSLARIFARELNIAPEDTYEIDAASYRKLENAKELKETIYTLPISSEYKMYIIDEAHMLTKEAWNALLKTIEEPPKHVIFIFATTEKHKVLPTIISRCVVFDFKNPSIGDLESLVQKIADKEALTLSEGESARIAHQARGSFRDALSVLEQRLHMGEEFGGVNTKDVENFLLSYQNPASALSVLEGVTTDALEYFVDLLVETVQHVLLVRYGSPGAGPQITLSKEAMEELLKKKEVNSKLLISLIELAQAIDMSHYKREYITAWILDQVAVEK